MFHTAIPKIIKLSFLLLLTALLSACGVEGFSPRHPRVSPTEDTTYPIDDTFQEFYNHFEAVKSLGPAITPAFREGNLIEQYVEAGLMVYDPAEPESSRYSLKPIGQDLGVEEPAVKDTLISKSRFINGHVIYGDFLALYNLLGGAQLVGLPLTEERHNLEKGRVEQYFENLGFYRLDGDPAGAVNLMAYGYYACDYACRYRPDALSIPGPRIVLEEPFGSVVSQLGLPFTGLLISPPRRGSDGRMEVILENLVLAVDPLKPSVITAKPIVELVGIQEQPLVGKSIDPLMVFIPIERKLGHNVPIYFYNYLQLHGDLALSGVPITEVYLTNQGIFQQCFKNLCLNYDPRAPESERLNLAPMGSLYKACMDSPDLTRCKPLGEGLRIRVWEAQNLLSSDQPQVIHIAVYDNGIPLKNREPILTITLPDGSHKIYNPPPTDSDGQTKITVLPIKAPSGTIIPYRVCLARMRGSPVCVGDNYLIWNYQN